MIYHFALNVYLFVYKKIHNYHSFAALYQLGFFATHKIIYAPNSHKMSCFFSIDEILNKVLYTIVLLFSHSDSILTNKFYNDPQEDEGDGKCELVGTFSLVTQAFLGLLCLSSLIIKRSYEFPVRRTWPVWFFDVSKQLLGALGIHVFNVMLSIFKSKDDTDDTGTGITQEDDDDPCSWYFLNIVFDCTIGVYVLYLVFKALNKICKDWLHISNIKSGEYGDPNRPSITAYFKQLTIYYISLIIAKFILVAVMMLFEDELLWFTSHILLVWLDDYPNEVEIFMVMFVVPIFMNCLQLVLVDNIIQNQYFRVRNNETELDQPDDDNAPKTYGTFE